MENGISSYRRYLDGDDEGLVELMRDYEDGLILYIDSIIHNIAISKELSEETFFKLAVKKPCYREEHSFKAWLYTIGRNIAKNYLIRHIIGKTAAGINDDIEDKTDIERDYIKSEEKIELYRAMMKLKREYRQVLVLVYFEELSNKEAAVVMNKSKRQIENLLYSAKKSLRAKLESEGFQYEGL